MRKWYRKKVKHLIENAKVYIEIFKNNIIPRFRKSIIGNTYNIYGRIVCDHEIKNEFFKDIHS